MKAASREFKKARRGWKQLPTVALAGCTLAGALDSSSASASVVVTSPSRYASDWNVMISRRNEGWTKLCPFLFKRDYVLGTSMDLVVWSDQAWEAAQVETVVLAEIERLRQILSRYDSRSELSQLNTVGTLPNASPDLIAVLRAYEMWTPRTGGALSPRVGSLVRHWKNAEDTGKTPNGDDIAACLENLRGPGWMIDSPSGLVRLLGNQPLNLDCLGKGYILKKAVEAARACFPGIWGIMLNIGGDMSVWGNGGTQANSPWRVLCADPHRPYDNAPPLTAIEIPHGAVATSGAYERGFTVAGRHYPHIIDPRTGWPAQGVASATVVARDSLVANFLATTLCVLTPDAGLDLLRTFEGSEGLIIGANGVQFCTPGFAALEGAVAQVSPVSVATNVAPASAGSVPSLGSSGSTPPAPATAPPLSPGQIVTMTTDNTVAFVKGASQIKRPVHPDENFRLTSVNGDNVGVSDQLGYAATVNRSILKAVPSTPPPAVATTSAPTNAAPVAPAPPPSPNAAPPPNSATWPATFQVTFSIELPEPAPNGKAVKLPYLVLWVVDATGKPIRTVTEWGTGKYMRALMHWWKFAHGDADLINKTTRPTRPAGKYQVVWDGLDDAGNPVPRGSYTASLEVVREYGARDIQSGTIVCGDSTAQGTIPGAREFLDCPIAYGPPGA